MCGTRRTGSGFLLALLSGGLVLLAWRSASPAPEAPRKPQSPYGRVEVLAGDRDFGDGGKAVRALFVGIGGLAVDPKGNVYVADSGNNWVRKIEAGTGVITTVAGTGLLSGDVGSEVASERPLKGPAPLALDAEGRHLYVG